ncbi:hypothetical protein Emed_005605 [Eimeria media]
MPPSNDQSFSHPQGVSKRDMKGSLPPASPSSSGGPPPSSAHSSSRGPPPCEYPGAPGAPCPGPPSGAPLGVPSSKTRRRRPRPKSGRLKTRQVSTQGPPPPLTNDSHQGGGAPHCTFNADEADHCEDSRWSGWGGPPEEEEPIEGGPPSQDTGRPEGGEGAPLGAPEGLPEGLGGRGERQQGASFEERRIREMQQEKLERAVKQLLLALPPEALSPEVLRKTPRRVASALSFFTKGYKETVQG